MVSYDDTPLEESGFDFDDFDFEKFNEEHAVTSSSGEEETSVGLEIEDSGQVGMEVDQTEQEIAPSQVFNMEPMLSAVHTPLPSRSTSPVSVDEESDSDTLFNPSPSPRCRPTRARLAKQISQTMFSPSPSPLVERDSSPAASNFSSSSLEEVRVKVERRESGFKKLKKRNSGMGRKGEPRRCQNMIAQKKYRDKKVHASNLMSETIIDIKAALRYASPKKAVGLMRVLMEEYDMKMKELDPNLASKQDQAVEDHASRYE